MSDSTNSNMPLGDQSKPLQWEVFRVTGPLNGYQRLPAVFNADTEHEAIEEAMRVFPGGGVFVPFRRANRSYAVDMPDTTQPLRIQEITR
jgi:hypothetical protein